MPRIDFLSPMAVLHDVRTTSKKHLLQIVSEAAAANTGQSSALIFETLLQRERLGSTGISDGLAIPHGKLPHLREIFGLMAKLERPIDFQSLDGKPVDLVFLLLAPESAGADHLKALAKIARLLRDAPILARLRAARDSATLHALLTEEPTSQAA
jgi:nitrogen PTS system EIIA component